MNKNYESYKLYFNIDDGFKFKKLSYLRKDDCLEAIENDLSVALISSAVGFAMGGGLPGALIGLGSGLFNSKIATFIGLYSLGLPGGLIGMISAIDPALVINAATIGMTGVMDYAKCADFGATWSQVFSLEYQYYYIAYVNTYDTVAENVKHIALSLMSTATCAIIYGLEGALIDGMTGAKVGVAAGLITDYIFGDYVSDTFGFNLASIYGNVYNYFSLPDDEIVNYDNEISYAMD